MKEEGSVSIDPAAAKANQQMTWRSVAPGWKKWAAELTKFTAPLTARMIAGLKPGQRVLDLASGVGDPAIAIARAVGPSGSVLGTDLVEEMLAFAREEAAAAGVKNIEFRHADAEKLDVPASSFDAATMRFGLMFLPDPVACLSRVHAALKPGGWMRAAVWQPPQKNPWAAIPMSVMRRHVDVPAPPPDAPGLFAMGDPARLESVFHGGGFSTVKIEELALVPADFDAGDEYLRFTLDLAGPIAVMHAKLTPAERPKVEAEIIKEALAAGGGKAHLPGAVWIATATK
jgi:SAM-dependent methyltransferase